MEKITEIIKGCIAKNPKYQRVVYDLYRGYAIKIVFRYINRYDRALDVVNDSFVKLFSNFQKFDPSNDKDSEHILMGWFKRILINTAIDELRKDNMMREIGGIPDYVWDIKDDSQQADQMLFYKDLMVAVKELPTSYRVVFNLYVIDGYTHSEISDMIKISIGTSKSSLSRARTLLQNNIKKMENLKYA